MSKLSFHLKLEVFVASVNLPLVIAANDYTHVLSKMTTICMI
jgi:hypothetical protein